MRLNAFLKSVNRTLESPGIFSSFPPLLVNAGCVDDVN